MIQQEYTGDANVDRVIGNVYRTLNEILDKLQQSTTDYPKHLFEHKYLSEKMRVVASTVATLDDYTFLYTAGGELVKIKLSELSILVDKNIIQFVAEESDL